MYAEAHEMPLQLRWVGIRAKLAATRARHHREETKGWLPQGQKQRAKRFADAGESDLLIKQNTDIWYYRRTPPRPPAAPPDVQESAVPFWEEAEVIWPGPQVRLPGKKAETSAAILRAATTEALEGGRESDLHIYTDGSKTDGKAGAGYWVPKLQAGGQYCTPTWCSVLTTEMIAIQQALQWAEEQDVMNRRIIVLTDSRSAMLQILFGTHYSENHAEREQIYRAARTIKQRGGQVCIGWVPSHCGTEGNEKADELAKQGALGRGPWVQHGPTKKEARREIGSNLQTHWQRDWETAPTGRFRFEVQAQLQP